MITPREVESVVVTGEIIEDYPEDARGHSCLLLGQGAGGRSLHVVCAPKSEYLAVITAYTPDPAQWSPDFKTEAKWPGLRPLLTNVPRRNEPNLRIDRTTPLPDTVFVPAAPRPYSPA